MPQLQSFSNDRMDWNRPQRAPSPFQWG